MILAAEASGSIAAIVTALGGVAVSLFTVYNNSRKQASATGANTGNIETLTEQLNALSQQVTELRTENAVLKAQVAIFQTLQVPVPVPEPVPTPKKKKPAVKKPAKKKEI